MSSVSRWAGIAREAQQATDIPASVLLGLIQVESGGTEGETSPAGAGGLTQFIPGTAREYHVDVRPGHARSQIFGAARYLQALGFAKDPVRALNAYNGAQVLGGRPNPYAHNVLSAARQYGKVAATAPVASAPSAPSAPQAASPDDQTSGGLAGLLAAVQQRQAPQASVPLQAPAFSAEQRYLRSAGPSPVSVGGPSPKPSMDQLLSLVPSAPAPVAPPGSTSQPGVSGAAGAPSSRIQAHGGYLYPLAKRGKIIGTPYQGTHTLYGNWESDNAVDIAVPKGTPVYAVGNGVIGSQIGPISSSDPHLMGQRVHLVQPNGQESYYAHLSRLTVHAGERVRAGQLIGYSGEANGVQHLHIASKRGSPLREFG